MTYGGRIIGLILLSINGVTNVLYHLSMGGRMTVMTMIPILILPIVGWFLGYQFDKVRLLNKEIQKSNSELSSLFENSYSYIWSVDLMNQKVTISKGLETIFGYSVEEFRDNFELWMSLSHPDDQDRLDAFYEQLLLGNDAKCEWRIIRKNKEVRWVEAFGNPILNGAGEVIKLSGVAYDVSDRKDMVERMEYMAYHDHLTGLPNRIRFNQILEKSLARCSRDGSELAFLFIDLDRFKFVNDTMGHSVGDTLLVHVGKRLSACVRDEDVVSRFGGDEFVILAEGVSHSGVEVMAERILTCFSTPFVLAGEEFYVTPSIGISLYPEDGLDSETLTIHADKAMYLAKNNGKNNYQFYIQENQSVLDRQMKIEQGLKRALANKEFKLYYQPTVYLDSGDIYGVEALIRWQHPELGLVSPMEFIPIAENIGMIIPIGKWVLDEACLQNKRWQETGIHIKTAVNVSALQFQDPRFVEHIRDVLAVYDLSPEYLGLEITESVMQNIRQSFTIIHKLKAIGVTVSIDDFGTGYSSLSILNNLPIDVVKIDKSFVNEITTNSKSASLIKTMIEMGKNLEFYLLAEGIETNQQAKFLLENGSRFGQGYYYSHPLPAEEVERLLMRGLVGVG